MVICGKPFDFTPEQVFAPLRHHGLTWFEVRSTRNQPELLEWAAVLGVPVKYLRGDRLVLPISVYQELSKYAAAG